MKLPDDEKIMQLAAFNAVFPDINCDDEAEAVQATLQQIVSNIHFDGIMPDYSQLLFPLLRLVDYLLNRQVLRYRPQALNTRGYANFGRAGIFDQSSPAKLLIEFVNDAGWNEEQEQVYLTLYNKYYRGLRNRIFHFAPNPMIVYRIDELDTAKSILIDGAELINDYFRLFNE